MTQDPAALTLTSALDLRGRGPGGESLGEVVDLVVDLAGGDRPAVTGLLLRTGEGRTLVRGPVRVVGSEDDLALQPVGQPDLPVRTGPPAERGTEELGPTEVLLARDVLDAPAVSAAPPRRSRVGQVRLEAGPDGLLVAGVELGAASVLSRLRARPVVGAGAPVPLASVHLLSPRAHAVQLALPGAMVFGVDPTGMAEVVTRTSVAHAREILQAADRAVVEEALSLLHPHVRERVTGAVPPRRRGRRLRGWRLHRPGPQHRPRGGDDRG